MASMLKFVRNSISVLLMLAYTSPSFSQVRGASCLTSISEINGFKLGKSDVLPKGAKQYRELPTTRGNVKISIVEGMRLIYHNKFNAPFINVKIESTKPNQGSLDKRNLLEHLKYLVEESNDLENEKLVQSDINGFEVYSYSKLPAKAGSILSSFVLFPTDSLIVYVYFHNLQPQYRGYKNSVDYKVQRDKFLKDFTQNLRFCFKKHEIEVIAFIILTTLLLTAEEIGSTRLYVYNHLS